MRATVAIGVFASAVACAACEPQRADPPSIAPTPTLVATGHADATWPLLPTRIVTYQPFAFHRKVNVVTDGDSLTGQPNAPFYDGGNAGPATWVPLVEMLGGTGIHVTNIAKGGMTCKALRAGGAQRVDSLFDPRMVANIVVVQCGVNDIVADRYDAGPAEVDPAIDALEAYARDRHAAHPWKVIVVGPTPSNFFNRAGYEHFAARIREECSTFADQCVDISSDPEIGRPLSYADLRWYVDNTHKTANGDVRYGMMVLAALVSQARIALDGGL